MSGFDAFEGDTPGATELNRLVEKAQRAFAWRGAVDELTADAAFEGVRVTVNGTGTLTALRLEEASCRDGGEALAQRILAATAMAQSTVSELVVASAKATFGEDSDEVATIEDSLAARRATLPTPEGGDA